MTDVTPLNLDEEPTAAALAPAPTVQPTGLDVDVYYNADRWKMMVAVATKYFNAKCFTSDVKNVEQALVKIQAGLEMGMGPAESMSALYLVNGKVTIFGTGMTKRLRERGWKIIVVEEKENSCHLKVSNGKEEYEYTATVEEVGALNSNALKFAKKDKLFWHAISRIVRRYVPEILGGGIQYTKEEMEDVEMKTEVKVVEKEEPKAKEPVKKEFETLNLDSDE